MPHTASAPARGRRRPIAEQEADEEDWNPEDYDWEPTTFQAKKRTKRGGPGSAVFGEPGGDFAAMGSGFEGSGSAKFETALTCPKFADLPVYNTITRFDVGNENICVVKGCGVSIAGLKRYFTRLRICEAHLGSSAIVVNGVVSRFCQQCGRFQPLSDFNGKKKSCIARLEKVNARHREKAMQQKQQRRPEPSPQPKWLEPQPSWQDAGPEVTVTAAPVAVPPLAEPPAAAGLAAAPSVVTPEQQAPVKVSHSSSGASAGHAGAASGRDVEGPASMGGASSSMAAAALPLTLLGSASVEPPLAPAPAVSESSLPEAPMAKSPLDGAEGVPSSASADSAGGDGCGGAVPPLVRIVTTAGPGLIWYSIGRPSAVLHAPSAAAGESSATSAARGGGTTEGGSGSGLWMMGSTASTPAPPAGASASAPGASAVVAAAAVTESGAPARPPRVVYWNEVTTAINLVGEGGMAASSAAAAAAVPPPPADVRLALGAAGSGLYYPLALPVKLEVQTSVAPHHSRTTGAASETYSEGGGDGGGGSSSAAGVSNSLATQARLPCEPVTASFAQRVVVAAERAGDNSPRANSPGESATGATDATPPTDKLAAPPPSLSGSYRSAVGAAGSVAPGSPVSASADGTSAVRRSGGGDVDGMPHVTSRQLGPAAATRVAERISSIMAELGPLLAQAQHLAQAPADQGGRRSGALRLVAAAEAAAEEVGKSVVAGACGAPGDRTGLAPLPHVVESASEVMQRAAQLEALLKRRQQQQQQQEQQQVQALRSGPAASAGQLFAARAASQQLQEEQLATHTQHQQLQHSPLALLPQQQLHYYPQHQAQQLQAAPQQRLQPWAGAGADPRAMATPVLAAPSVHASAMGSFSNGLPQQVYGNDQWASALQPQRDLQRCDWEPAASGHVYSSSGASTLYPSLSQGQGLPRVASDGMPGYAGYALPHPQAYPVRHYPPPTYGLVNEGFPQQTYYPTHNPAWGSAPAGYGAPGPSAFAAPPPMPHAMSHDGNGQMYHAVYPGPGPAPEVGWPMGHAGAGTQACPAVAAHAAPNTAEMEEEEDDYIFDRLLQHLAEDPAADAVVTGGDCTAVDPGAAPLLPGVQRQRREVELLLEQAHNLEEQRLARNRTVAAALQQGVAVHRQALAAVPYGGGAADGAGFGGMEFDRVSIKAMALQPEELPGNLRSGMGRWLAGARAEALQATLRPGCLQLIIDILRPAAAAAAADLASALIPAGDSEQAAADVFRFMGQRLRDTYVQVGDQVLAIRVGEDPVVMSWEQAAEEGGLSGAKMPVLQGCSAAAVTAGCEAKLQLHGMHLDQQGTKVFARLRGRDLRATVAVCADAGAAGAAGEASEGRPAGRSLAVAVNVPPGALGLMVVEVGLGHLLGGWWPVLVLPRGSEGAAEELRSLQLQAHGGPGMLGQWQGEGQAVGAGAMDRRLLYDLGQVLDIFAAVKAAAAAAAAAVAEAEAAAAAAAVTVAGDVGGPASPTPSVGSTGSGAGGDGAHSGSPGSPNSTATGGGAGGGSTTATSAAGTWAYTDAGDSLASASAVGSSRMSTRYSAANPNAQGALDAGGVGGTAGMQAARLAAESGRVTAELAAGAGAGQAARPSAGGAGRSRREAGAAAAATAPPVTAVRQALSKTARLLLFSVARGLPHLTALLLTVAKTLSRPAAFTDNTATGDNAAAGGGGGSADRRMHREALAAAGLELQALLPLAVLSGITAVVDELTSFAAAFLDEPLRLDLPQGPAGTTLLHLAAVMDDGGIMAAHLIATQPWAAWSWLCLGWCPPGSTDPAAEQEQAQGGAGAGTATNAASDSADAGGETNGSVAVAAAATDGGGAAEVVSEVEAPLPLPSDARLTPGSLSLLVGHSEPLQRAVEQLVLSEEDVVVIAGRPGGPEVRAAAKAGAGVVDEEGGALGACAEGVVEAWGRLSSALLSALCEQLSQQRL